MKNLTSKLDDDRISAAAERYVTASEKNVQENKFNHLGSLNEIIAGLRNVISDESKLASRTTGAGRAQHEANYWAAVEEYKRVTSTFYQDVHEISGGKM